MLELNDVKKVNEELNGYLDLTIDEWEQIEEEKIKSIKRFSKNIEELLSQNLSPNEAQELLQDAENLKNIELESLNIKEKQLSDIIRNDLVEKIKELKEKVKDASKYKDPFTKSIVAGSAAIDINAIKEVLRAEKTLYNKLADVGEKIWNKTVAPLIEAIKSPVLKVREAAVEKGAHMVVLAKKYSTAVKDTFAKVGDLTKGAYDNISRILAEKCLEIEKHDIIVDMRNYKKKMGHLDEKLGALCNKRNAVQDKIIVHEIKRCKRKGINIEGPIKVNTPTIDKKIADICKDMVKYEEKLFKAEIKYIRVENEQRAIVNNEISATEEKVTKQFADLKTQFDNASDFDLAMAGELRVNDKVMESVFAEKTIIKGEEVPVYRVVIDSDKIRKNNILNPRAIANLSADERIYPTNQGYSYLYTTDPERAVEWGQEFSKRGVLHEKGVECSSEKAKELFNNIAKEAKNMGIKQNKIKTTDDIEL